MISHPAVRHPFLQQLSTGGFNQIDDVIAIILINIHSTLAGFLNMFRVLLTAQMILEVVPIAENLAEELGLDDTDSNNIPHRRLYKTFKKDIGIDAEFENENPMCLTVSLWRELFLQKCKSENTAVGVAAIGLATEFIVPHFYPFIIDALEKHSSFPNECSFFLGCM